MNIEFETQNEETVFVRVPTSRLLDRILSHKFELFWEAVSLMYKRIHVILLRFFFSINATDPP